MEPILGRTGLRRSGPVGEAYIAKSTDDIMIRLEPGELRIWDVADEY